MVNDLLRRLGWWFGSHCLIECLVLRCHLALMIFLIYFDQSLTQFWSLSDKCVRVNLSHILLNCLNNDSTVLTLLYLLKGATIGSITLNREYLLSLNLCFANHRLRCDCIYSLRAHLERILLLTDLRGFFFFNF